MARPRAKFDIVAEDKTARAFKSVDGRLDAMGRAAKSVGAVVATAVTGLGVLGIRTLRAADEQAKLAQATGFTVQELGRLAHAAELSGTSFDRVAKSGVNRFSRSIFDANAGLKESAEVFDAMGITIKNLDGTLKSNAGLLDEVADKFATYEDGAAKSALAQKLFGRAGAEMIPLLNAGSAGLDRMGDEAEQLGIVFNDKTGKAAERFNDNLTRLKGAYTGQVNAITQHLLPTLEALSNRAVANAKDNVTLARTGEAVSAGFKLAVSAAKVVTTTFGLVGRAAGAAAAIIIDQFKLAGEVMGGVAAAVVRAAKGDFTGAWGILQDVGNKGVKTYRRHLDVLKSAHADMQDVAFDAITSIADTWQATGVEIEQATPELAGKIAAPLVEAKDKLSDAASDLPDVVDDVAIDPMVEAAKNGIERLGDVFAQGWRDILDGNASFGDSMKSWFKGLLAELIHAATTNRIVVGISGALGLGGSGMASAATGGGFLGGSGGFSLTDLAGLPLNFASSALRYTGSALGNMGFTGAQRFLNSGVANLNAADPFLTGGAGLLGGFAANKVFGGGVATNIGSTGGALLAAAAGLGPLGIGLAAFGGGGLGSLFGGEPSPPKFHFYGGQQAFDPITDNDGWARSVESFGAFGGIQFAAQHIGDNNDFLKNQGFVDAIAGVDNLIAATIDERFLAAAESRAQGFRLYSKHSMSGEQIFAGRAQEIARALLPGFSPGAASSNFPGTIEGVVGSALVGSADVQEVTDNLGRLSAAIDTFGRSVVERTIDVAGFNNQNFDQFFADVELVGLLGGAFGDTTVTAGRLASGIEAIDDKFDQLASRARTLGLPLERLNDLRAAEKRQLEQTLGLGGVRDLLNSFTATSASPLAQNTVLQNANRLYRDTISAAGAGDQLALNQIPGVANNLIGLLRNQFSHGANFFGGVDFNAPGMALLDRDRGLDVAGFDQIRADLEWLLGRPGFADGGITTGLSFAHAGEAVIPLDSNRSVPVTIRSDMVAPVVTELQVANDIAAANGDGQAVLLQQVSAQLAENNRLLKQLGQQRAVAR